MSVTATRKKSYRHHLAAALTFAGVLAATGPGTTHPHIWIDASATLVFEHGALVGVETRWDLDPFVSALLMEDFDADKNGIFEPEEAMALEQATFVGLSEFGFYTHMRVDGVASSPETVLDFRPSIRDDIVVYDFFVPLPEPVDPSRQRVDIAFYDETYFTDLYYEEASISLGGDQTGGCSLSLREDIETPIYFGMVFPLRIGLRCAEG